MKKTFLLTAVGAMLVMGSCTKKGENDPFLSFMSRDARITGTWKLVSMTSSDKDIFTPSGGTATTDVTTQTYDGTLLTSTDSTDGNQNWQNSVSYTQEIMIEKDGSYHATTTDDGDKSENTGHWWWLDDKKKKTRLAFDDDFGSYDIDRLKNKEMVLTRNYTSKDTDSGGDVSETVFSSTMTFEKQK